MKFDETYWNDRYTTAQTQWDIGYPATPLVTYFDQLDDSSLRILIPGCGNAYEAEYLIDKGFTNVFLIDISSEAIERIKRRMPQLSKEHIIHGDFFEHSNTYDIIIEQTFFCALHPSMREQYAKKMHALLKPEGKLVGLLFDDPLFTDHPPFGGNKEAYIPVLDPYFKFHAFERAYNSIPPRMNREIFMILQKKNG